MVNYVGNCIVRLKRNWLILLIRARKVTLPFFDGIPLYDVALYFVRAIVNGGLTMRASAIAYNFFLSIFPTLIFLIALFPFIPIDGFAQQMIFLLEDIMPYNAFKTIEGTVTSILTNTDTRLLSFGFFGALWFSSNGMDAVINAFNASLYITETRTWWNQRVISFLLMLIFFVLILVSVVLIIISQIIIDYLVSRHLMMVDFTYYLLLTGKWIIVVALQFTAFSSLFYFAPARRTKWRFISVGGTLATVLTVVISLGFSFYINNFGRYNTLYGSIGTLIVIMLWIYFNAMSLLIGFELNASIKTAGAKHLSRRKIAIKEP